MTLVSDDDGGSIASVGEIEILVLSKEELINSTWGRDPELIFWTGLTTEALSLEGVIWRDKTKNN